MESEVESYKLRKILHWFHLSIPCNDTLNMTKTEGGFVCVYVIFNNLKVKFTKFKDTISKCLMQFHTQFYFYHHVSWRLSKTAMKDALPFPLPLTAATQLSADLHLTPSTNTPTTIPHYSPDLRYRQHSTKPLPTNLMCSLALKCASSTHNPLEILFLLPLPKCHQFSRVDLFSPPLQPPSPP